MTTKAVNLARVMTGEIEAGRYKVGQKIPTEAELQQRFDVSRHTVREALRDLKSRGLILARAGVGTVVRTRESTGTSFMQGAGTLEEVIQFGEATRMKVLEHGPVIADAGLAEEIAAKPGQELHRVSLLRYRPREALPGGRVDIYLRPEHADVLADIETSRMPVLRLVERSHGVRITEVVQKILAATLGAAEARLLKTRPGTPALHVTRHYFDSQDRLVMATVGLYPSDRFSHNTRFRIRQTEQEPA
ncbi:MAG TPA: GntR family transcriptional regulator [Usitatibacter sp.]|nr:GntR family transcriptional regulator [Usitatibacter sp.]